MTASSTPPLPDFVPLLAFGFLMLAPLALAGLALLNAGLGRSRSAAQALLGSVAIVSVSFISFAGIGACFAGSSGSWVVTVAGKSWDWIGTGPILLRHMTKSPLEAQVGMLFECLAVALVGLIPWGAGADRMRLAAGWAAAAVLGVFAFPLLAHWVWGGGWLQQLGANFGLGAGFLDGSGAGTVHVLGAPALLPWCGLRDRAGANSPRKAWPRRCPATMPLTCCLAACWP